MLIFLSDGVRVAGGYVKPHFHTCMFTIAITVPTPWAVNGNGNGNENVKQFTTNKPVEYVIPFKLQITRILQMRVCLLQR